ncbi:Dephospho-CoA kinase [hydrothermal vent metagenome]|uniref:Dephospho-CoA kinase n=1 Tax=hydrothermal vent metagenome TaxID=652676 RepID=A0A1W1BUC7_9ZZZZ
MAFKYAVVLTGSIGTGKSSVAKILLQRGFSVIDADKIAHRVLDEQKETIVQMFGEHLLVAERVDRKALGAIVFADVKKRKKLEALLHPLIYEQIYNQAIDLDEKKYPYFIDIPLFFETKRYPIDKVLVIYAPQEKQLQRLMHRDAMPEEEAWQRITTQIDIEEKARNAGYVIDNSGTLSELEQETLHVLEEIQKDFQ